MYWCKTKTRTTIFITGLACLLAACRPDIKETKYFDIKGFFKRDTAFLNRQHTPVLKTVTHNGVTESKKVRIENWGRELNFFIEADINKPAWKNSYTVTNNNGFLIYKAKTEDLRVREIMIKLDKSNVKWILIFTRTKNMLYQTTEKLTYYPDSLYLIEKYQEAKLMGNNTYRIEGKIKY